MPGAFKLDHLLIFKPILFPKFSSFFTFYTGEANSYYPREGKAENGKMEFSQPGCESGISVPGAFKLVHLQPVKPILFSNLSTFILGANSNYTRERKAENGKMSHLLRPMRTEKPRITECLLFRVGGASKPRDERMDRVAAAGRWRGGLRRQSSCNDCLIQQIQIEKSYHYKTVLEKHLNCDPCPWYITLPWHMT